MRNIVSHTSRRHARMFTCCLAAIVLFNAGAVSACSVPVFEYALERWPVDPYHVLIFHRGPLSGKDRKVLDRLTKLSHEHAFPVEVLVVDVSRKLDDSLRAVYEACRDCPLPGMVLRYPGGKFGAGIAWFGKLDEASLKALLQSPARTEVTRRLAGGDVAIWVLLESGDAQKDDAAFELLDSTLRKLERMLELPEGFVVEEVDGEQVEPRIAFWSVRVSRTDAEEHVFVEMLVHSERGLTQQKYASQPMAVPIYGRGRKLRILVGKGINERNIWRTCDFLVGPCFCEAKADNPGTQLLISADWDILVTTYAVEIFPPLTGWPELADVVDESEDTTCPVARIEEPVSSRDALAAEAAEPAAVWSLGRSIIVAGVILAVVVAGFSIVLVYRSTRARQ